MVVDPAVTKNCNQLWTHSEPQNLSGVTRIWHVTNGAMIGTYLSIVGTVLVRKRTEA